MVTPENVSFTLQNLCICFFELEFKCQSSTVIYEDGNICKHLGETWVDFERITTLPGTWLLVLHDR